MRNFRMAVRFVCYHGKILLRGFAKVLYGAAVAGLIVLAVYGFQAIPTEGGYAAVGDFVCAVATTVVALGCMYAFGCSRKKTGRFSG